MKRRALLLCLSILSLFSSVCVSQKKIADIGYDRGFDSPMVFPTDSSIYFCSQHIVSYRKEPFSQDYIERDVCNCFSTLISLLEEEIITHSTVNYFDNSNGNTIIIWDKNFIINYILPLFKRKEDRKKIEYTLANSNDSTFTSENVIDYNNKVIINDKMYYYPLKIKQTAKVIVTNIPKFYSILPKSSWIFYSKDCFDDGKSMYISLLIPLLDENENKKTKGNPHFAGKKRKKEKRRNENSSPP